MKKVLTSVNPFPYLPIILTPIILLSPVMFSRQALFWGATSTQFVPWWKWSFDTLLTGQFPLWNPLLGMGAPLIANYQSALFYPPNWIYFVFYFFGGISALAWSQAFVVTLHLIVAGLGMATLTKELGLGRLAQTISGLAFSLSGYIVARGLFPSINSAIVWLPWTLVFSYKISMNDNKFMSTLKLGFIIGMQLLAGHAQTTWYTWLLAGCWVFFGSWKASQRERVRTTTRIGSVISSLLHLLVAIFIGISLSAIQLFPTGEYLLQSQRATTTDYETAMTYSFWPWRLLGLITPGIFGSPVQGNYWGYGNYWEDALYIGLTPILLAIGVAFRSLFRYHQHKTGGWRDSVKPKEGRINQEPKNGLVIAGNDLPWFLLAICLISLILALGRNLPIFPWLYRNIPTFDMFQAPTRFSIWMVTSLALLAGIGVETWERPTNRGLYWTRLGTAGAFAVTIAAGIGGYLLKDIASDFKPTFVPAIAIAGFWGLGTGLLSLTVPLEGKKRKIPYMIWSLSVTLWVSTDLLVAGFGLNPGIDLEFYTGRPGNFDDIREMVGEGRLFFKIEDEQKLKYDKYFRFDTFDPGEDWFDVREIFLPNLNMFEGIPVVNNYDPLVPDRFADWMVGIEDVNIQDRTDLLDRMGVTVLEWSAPSGVHGVRFVPRNGASRIRWVPCASYVENEGEARELVLSGRLNPLEVVVIEGEEIYNNQPCEPFLKPPKILVSNPHQVVIESQSDSPGWIVLSDVWYPGWQARLDGEKIPIYHGDYLFRAVKVPYGHHQVQFLYRPTWFFIGAVISVLTWIGLTVIIRFRKK